MIEPEIPNVIAYTIVLLLNTPMFLNSCLTIIFLVSKPSNIFSGFSFGKQPTTDLASNTKSFSFASPAADPIAFGSSNATNASFGLPNLKSSDISAKSAFSFGSDAGKFKIGLFSLKFEQVLINRVQWLDKRNPRHLQIWMNRN